MLMQTRTAADGCTGEREASTRRSTSTVSGCMPSAQRERLERELRGRCESGRGKVGKGVREVSWNMNGEESARDSSLAGRCSATRDGEEKGESGVR